MKTKPKTQTPYAYSISDYDDLFVYPTLAAAAIGEEKRGVEPYYLWLNKCVTAHFQDGTETQVDLRDFIEKIEVDEKAIALKIDKQREAKRKADEKEMQDTLKSGRPLITVTGCAPIYMLDRDDLIQREVQRQMYRWKK